MNSLHHIVAIPKVSLTDRVEIITLLLVSHTIGPQNIKVRGLKTMATAHRVRSLQLNLDLLLQL